MILEMDDKLLENEDKSDKTEDGSVEEKETVLESSLEVFELETEVETQYKNKFMRLFEDDSPKLTPVEKWSTSGKMKKWSDSDEKNEKWSVSDEKNEKWSTSDVIAGIDYPVFVKDSMAQSISVRNMHGKLK